MSFSQIASYFLEIFTEIFLRFSLFFSFLGHMGILFAKALGAEKITAISHTHSKEELSKQLGATDFLATADGDKAWEAHAKSLDVVVITNNNHDMDIKK